MKVVGCCQQRGHTWKCVKRRLAEDVWPKETVYGQISAVTSCTELCTAPVLLERPCNVLQVREVLGDEPVSSRAALEGGGTVTSGGVGYALV